MSTALAFDVEVVWLIPPYTKFLGVDETSHEKITFTVEKNVIFKVSIALLSFKMNLNAN